MPAPASASWPSGGPGSRRWSTGLERESCRRSLARFVRCAWPVVEPGCRLNWNWHIDAICEHLQAVTNGDIRRLIINVPPGHMKSLLVSVFWPAWEWIDRPHLRSLFGSSDEALAMRDQVRTRDLILSEWYQQTFDPRWRLKPDQNTKHNFQNTVHGFRQAFTLGGKIIGHRGDKVVVDDPLDAKNQFNKAVKDQNEFDWDKRLSTRVNDPRQARFVIIMQRLAADDLAGRLLERLIEESGVERRQYEHVCLPSEFDPRRRSRTSIGWEDPRREKGELLFPEMYTAGVLAEAKVALGSAGYAGQHQQRPTAEGGGRFNRAWFRYWTRSGRDLLALHPQEGEPKLVRPSLCRVFATMDSADSLKRAADYTVVSLWAVSPEADLVLLDRWRGRWEDPRAVRRCVALQRLCLARGYPPIYFVVEDNGVGLPRVQNLRSRGLAVKAVHVHSDKLSRSLTAVIRCEAGQVYWPDESEAGWLAEWEQEHADFPYGAHDDQVDTTSLAAIEVFGVGPAGKPAEVVSVEARPLHGRRPDFGRRGIFGR